MSTLTQGTASEQRRRRVLVVEDNEDGRESLRRILEIWGFDVEAVEDGKQGVDKALIWHPHYALVDIDLPILNGYEVARRLRTALGPEVFLVALTAYGQPDDRRAAFRAGFDAHLTKPANLDTLACLLGEGLVNHDGSSAAGHFT